MTTILGIDTASPHFALALAADGKIVSSFAREAGQDHSKLLLGAIEEILGGRRAELAGLAAVKGPGSYAGLRVGIATAQGLALSLDLPLRGLGTLEAVALASGLLELTAIHPAGRGEFAAQAFRDGKPAGPLGAAKPADLAGLTLAGEGAGALGGTEIGPEERCRAAVLALLPAFAVAGAEAVDALYLREPNVTLSRRPDPALAIP